MAVVSCTVAMVATAEVTKAVETARAVLASAAVLAVTVKVVMAKRRRPVETEVVQVPVIPPAARALSQAALTSPAVSAPVSLKLYSLNVGVSTAVHVPSEPVAAVKLAHASVSAALLGVLS